MTQFKWVPSQFEGCLESQGSGLVQFDDIVRVENVNGNLTAVQNLTEKFAELQTAINAKPESTAISSAVDTALNNNLKTITINGTPYSLIKDQSDNTININTQTAPSGGGGSTVQYSGNYNSGLTIGIITIDGNNADVKVPQATSSQTGCLSNTDYSNFNKGCYLEVSATTSDLNTKIGADTLSNAFSRVVSCNSYYIFLHKLANYTFTAEGLIKWDGSRFSLDTTNKVFRKYLVVQSSLGSISNRTATLLYSSDMFEYNAGNNTLSINN